METLVAADMLDHLRTLLAAAGEDKPEDYDLKWANFAGGPSVIAAATGGSVDVGWMAETPLVFSQAAGSPVKVIAAALPVNPDAGGIGLAVARNSPIRSIADLKGKKVFYLPGTILQYVLVELLEREGLSLNDIETVTAVGGTGPSPQLLESGKVDAAVLIDPVLLTAEQSGEVRLLNNPHKDLHSGTRYVVAPVKVLEDEAAQAVLGDFLARVVRAYQWQIDNFDEAILHTARLYKLPPEQAAIVLHRTLSRFVPINDDIIATHQRQADTFTRIGLVKKQLDARELFDTRFNGTVARTAKTVE